MADNTQLDLEARRRHVARQKFITYFLRVPYWAFYALPRANRPHPDWTLERVVQRKVVMTNNRIAALAGIKDEPTYHALETGPGIKGLWIKPTPHLIVGEVKKWAEDAGVECARIPAYWQEKNGVDRLMGVPPKPGEKILYHLHGGGYSALSAHPNNLPSRIPRAIMEHTPIERSFNLEYRVTEASGINPFPAALLDAIAGYNYLIQDVAAAPEDIILEGDSAGANLALALVRYLVENADNGTVKLPKPPGAMILCSPWADMSIFDIPRESELRKYLSIYRNRRTDYIDVAGKSSAHAQKLFFGPLGRDAGETNRYLSPASPSPKLGKVSFKGFPRTFVLSGSLEVFADQILLLVARMKEDMGADMVEFLEQPHAVHDFLVFPWHEPERTESLQRIAKWLFPGYVDTTRKSWFPRAKL
ncbi:esterase [Phanerochaete sordida]|uniref:Esterase n=1 Tax=Phanerochaete sordida TaxID=48140 RepID=A0A9P3FYC1_9APHY|nr:esterase [Phanerochaete sordida]